MVDKSQNDGNSDHVFLISLLQIIPRIEINSSFFSR